MTSMAQFKLDEEKFRELVIYIAGQCETDPAFGAVKLNKLHVFEVDHGGADR